MKGENISNKIVRNKIYNYLYIIFIIIYFLLCKPKLSTGYIFPEGDISVDIHFQYGEKVNYNEGNSTVENWKPVVQEEFNSLCIYSHPLVYRSKENGIFLKICSEFFYPHSEMINKGFEFSEESPVVQINDNIEFKTISLSQLVNQWRDSQPNIFILGDRFIAESFEREDITAEHPFYLFGTQKNIHSNYSLPYFSLISDAENLYIYFPEVFKGGRKDSIKYVYFKFGKKIITNFNIDALHSNITKKNSDYLYLCKSGSLTVTEVNPLSSSNYKKFIEFMNSTDDALCINDITLSINKKNYSYKNNSGFLLPGEVVVWSEEESRLHSSLFPEFIWGELRLNSEFLLMIHEEIKSYYKNQSIKTTLFEDGEISIQTLGLRCGNLLDLFSDSTICMDPGIHLPIQRKFCDVKNFELSEMNPIGLRGKADGKYIEIEYTSDEKCDISGIELEIDERTIPLSIKRNWIEKGNIIVIGEKKYFRNINLIPRNLEYLKINSSLILKSGESKFILLNTIVKEIEFILNSSYEKTFSVIKINSELVVHPFIPNFGFVPPWGDLHAGSPGEKNNFQNIPGIGKITEINRFGSYSSTESHPGDKFLELELGRGSDYRLVEKVSDKVVKIFFLPSVESSTTLILSENKLFCFPKEEVFFIDNFPSINPSSSFELYSGNALLDKIHLEETGSGEENRSTRLRRSSTRISNSSNWKNSFLSQPQDSMNSACFPFTHATPGKKSRFLPYLKKTIRDKDNLKIVLQFSETLSEDFFEGIVHNHYSKLELPFLVNNRDPIIVVPNVNINQEELLYISWRLLNDINLVQQPGLRIEGLSPNPKNSQNEWVLLCNRSDKIEYIQNYEIQDIQFFDKIVPYHTRFQDKNLFSSQDLKIDLNSDVLQPEQCGFLVDPDAFNPVLYSLLQDKIPIFTVRDDLSIGNGIGVDENINLFKINNNKKFLISSYGNMYSSSPFKIRASEDEIVVLKEGKEGDSPLDYRITK